MSESVVRKIETVYRFEPAEPSPSMSSLLGHAVAEPLAQSVEMVRGAERAAVAPEIVLAIKMLLQAFESRQSVTLIVGDELSSQQAADVLNVSRPHVVKLAEQGVLAFRKVGNRRRFLMSDVVAYDEQLRARRAKALAAIAPEEGYGEGDF